MANSKRNRSRGGHFRASRVLRFELLEDRRVLSTMADVVFLVDNSGSDDPQSVKNWLNSAVDELDIALRSSPNNFDVRYGLVAYGEHYQTGPFVRFAHSVVVDADTTKPASQRLFSSGATAADHLTDLHSALTYLISLELGGTEDGWDAIDHAIAEYDFRPGAVPVFILVQNNQGRLSEDTGTANISLTHDGVLAALKSKNVTLNTLTVGQLLTSDTSETLFDLAPYEFSEDIRVLGVDPDIAGNGAHTFHWVDTDTVNTTADVPGATTSDALQVSYNGSNTGATGLVGTGKSVLIGQNISGGIGPSASGYRARRN